MSRTVGWRIIDGFVHGGHERTRFTYIGQNSADFCTRLQKIQKESASCIIGGKQYIPLSVKMTTDGIVMILRL